MKHETPGISALLLAAGPSSRLGRAKQLVQVQGECLVRRSARLLLAQDNVPVTVVVGCEADRISREVSDLPVTIVINRDWEQGMGGSLSCGVRHIKDDFDGILVMACDQWRLEESDIARMIDVWSPDPSTILVASWSEGQAQVSGPPVIFPRKFRPDLIAVVKNRGARQVIDRHIDHVRYLNLENAGYDLDRPEDLQKIGRTDKETI